MHMESLHVLMESLQVHVECLQVYVESLQVYVESLQVYVEIMTLSSVWHERSIARLHTPHKFGTVQ